MPWWPLRWHCQCMRSMEQREADSQGMLDPVVTLDLVVTQAFLGTPVLRDAPVSRVDAEFRGLRLSQHKAALQDRPLGDWARRGLRERAFPIADRDSQRVGLCIVRPMEIAPDPGIGITGAARGALVCMAMGIRDGVGIRTPMSSIRDFTIGEIQAILVMGLEARIRAMRI